MILSENRYPLFGIMRYPFTRSAFATTGLARNCADDGGEMLEVVDLEIDQHVGEVRRPPRHADIVDIAVVLGDHLGDLRERAGLVHRLHRDARRKAPRRAFLLVPAHVEPALRLVLELAQRRRLDRIDGDPLARREDADDAVARHRAAVGRKAHRQVAVDAADRDRRRRRA